MVDNNEFIEFIRERKIPFSSSNDTRSEKEMGVFEEKKDYDKKSIDILRYHRFKSNTSLRVYLARWASVIVTLWLMFIGLILTKNNDMFCLSDTVLEFLLTTTTIQVLGIIVIAMSDLFNGKSEK